ncbi:DNA-processing protein DprA, partial [Streptomyces fradiae]|uniref:DNA-processing protein DprA n=1 Tax=Streptomyces fradiae TaxID=1906 RepID=UPI00367A6950
MESTGPTAPVEHAGPGAREAEDTRPGVPDEERIARAALSRVIEPGDPHGGRWLRELGAVEVLRRLSAEPYRPGALTGASERRLQGYLGRMPRVRPHRDLEAVHALGGRFVVPGDAEWPSQLDDLGDARPVGLWVRGAADLRRWALRSVALVGARACTPYGAHMAAVGGGGGAEAGGGGGCGGGGGRAGAAPPGAPAAGGAPP